MNIIVYVHSRILYALHNYLRNFIVVTKASVSLECGDIEYSSCWRGPVSTLCPGPAIQCDVAQYAGHAPCSPRASDIDTQCQILPCRMVIKTSSRYVKLMFKHWFVYVTIWTEQSNLFILLGFAQSSHSNIKRCV